MVTALTVQLYNFPFRFDNIKCPSIETTIEVQHFELIFFAGAEGGARSRVCDCYTLHPLDPLGSQDGSP